MNIARLSFVVVSLLALCLGFFVFGILSVQKGLIGYRLYQQTKQGLDLILSEDRAIAFSGPALNFLQPSRKPGQGVTVNTRPGDGKMILMSGFFDGANGLRLIARDGTEVARWSASFSADFPNPDHLPIAPSSDHNVDLHGVVINPDGSVVFNYEYGGTVKRDKCGNLEWALAYPTHHSVEFAEAGGYWILGSSFLDLQDSDAFPPFTFDNQRNRLRNDEILRVSEDGKITRRISLPGVLYDNGLEPLLTAGGFWFSPNLNADRVELVHSNKVGELSSELADAFPNFAAGDLIVSLRNYNLLFVIDPNTNRIKWHQTGPWVRQHDPEFNSDGTISVFNNNAYATMHGRLSRTDLSVPWQTTILSLVPRTGDTSVLYGGREGQQLLSVLRGKHDPVPGGGLFITEFEAGRAFEVDADGQIVWEYINRYDDKNVLEISEARLLPPEYFDVEGWSCP